ncbi:efflux RND transporter periplasmic adaptor subunit [Aliivibrio finisterrensis]|uniref:Efflux RND transporter periplasmic adaptor subunit n=1 Tax=Aliivibrio finisterrensis TaxID=511998 RepID=A0A6N6RUB6_9GAMM|nr:efflux RND transporter periplasmic adaptor subunit [Aliivibrio finisterrensis]KAB2825049.1 efflux RND transporter periplasmic adaptor subunit [Aliivibrio finisterrensis]
MDIKKSRFAIVVIVVSIIIFGSVIGFNLFVKHKISVTLANLPTPVYPVSVEKLSPRIWPQRISAIGFIEPNQGANISTEIAGIIKSIDFKNGAKVERNQTLLSLDSSVQQAQLKTLEVQLLSIKDDYLRLKKLYKDRSVSEQIFETAESKYQAALANIDELKAVIKQRIIKAPFNGVLGIRNVNLGEFISSGTSIVRLEDLSVMRVRFGVPQSKIGKISVGQNISLTVETFPGEEFKGRINAIEPTVSSNTGLVMVQAELPNSQENLRGGMFAEVNIALNNLDKQFVVPQTAIAFALYGNSVFVIQKDDNDKVTRVRLVNVEVLQRDKNNALIKGDLTFGEEIVTVGILNLGNNTEVNIVPNQISVPTSMPKL